MTNVRRGTGHGAIWFRALGALAILAGLFATINPSVSARGDGVDGSTFTGVNFDWTVAWDDKNWRIADEDNTGGSDFVLLESTANDFGMLGFIAKSGFAGMDASVEGWVDINGRGDGAEDLELMDDPTGIPVRSDAAAATFTYSQALEGGTYRFANYVQCLPLNDGNAALNVSIMTTEADLEEVLEALEKALLTIETPRAGVTSFDEDAGNDSGDGRDEDDEDSGDDVVDAEGETDAGGEYATYRLTQDDRDGEEITRIAYVECRTLVEDEAVLVISLYATEETFDEIWDDATAVMDSIELDDAPLRSTSD